MCEQRREKDNPSRDPKIGLDETNISLEYEKVFLKRMSPVCNTGVENN
jgi:hypothetical protein